MTGLNPLRWWEETLAEGDFGAAPTRDSFFQPSISRRKMIADQVRSPFHPGSKLEMKEDMLTGGQRKTSASPVRYEKHAGNQSKRKLRHLPTAKRWSVERPVHAPLPRKKTKQKKKKGHGQKSHENERR
jgi:hypothetical protein